MTDTMILADNSLPSAGGDSRKRKGGSAGVNTNSNSNSSTKKSKIKPTSINDSLDITVGKKTSTAKWFRNLEVAELRVTRGNYWRVMGYSEGGKNYLHPEEALYLLEKNHLAVFEKPNVMLRRDEFYNAVVKGISLPCYLVYSKLKSLDYIVMRHGKSVRNIPGDSDVYDLTQLHPGESLFDLMVSYTIFPNSSSWSKRSAATTIPSSYVVVTSGEYVFSAPTVLSLLSQANGVPITFAAVTSTGHVLLEEFSDALSSLAWDPIVSNSPSDKCGDAKSNDIDDSVIRSTDDNSIVDVVEVEVDAVDCIEKTEVSEVVVNVSAHNDSSGDNSVPSSERESGDVLEGDIIR